MKQLYYVIQTLMHGRNANVIKIISLGLGLTMSILLFSRVAYEQSFDTCFKDNENLYQLWTKTTVGEKTYPASYQNVGKLAGGILESLPDVVEYATSTGHWMVGEALYNGNVCFEDEKIVADSLFFQTMGIEVLCGNPMQDLQQVDVIYLSKELADKMFDGENPIGKVVSYNREFDLTVKGVYATIPYNSTMKPKAVISMPSAWNRNVGNYSWMGGESWNAYIRIKPHTDIEAMNKRINLMVQQRIPKDVGYNMEILAKPIRDTYRGFDIVKRMTPIMSILGACILLITALNYVLLSISSISRRAKAVGVHKCSGAENGTIFGMFLWETGVIIILSLLLMGFLILNFQDFVEDIASTKLAFLFAIERIWVPLGVILALFLIGGILPGYIFSHIPVTQVFKRYTEGKKSWKRSLLFVQFAGVAFIMGMMIVVIVQYYYVLNKDTGYNPERIAILSASGVHPQGELIGIKSFIEKLPYVEAFTSSLYEPTGVYSGEMIHDENGNTLFSSKWDYVQDNYTEVLGITVKQGHTPRKSGEVAVNEKWLEMRNWTADKAIGNVIQTEEGKVKVVGVLKNFHLGNFFEEQLPFVMHHFPNNMGVTMYIRLKESFVEHLQKFEKEIKDAFPSKNFTCYSMKQKMANNYNSVRVFRNATIVASFVIFFITLMGLIGYTNDETGRRSKEIAIRKVNGAEAWGIIELLAKDVLCMALPAVLVGTLSAWYIGELWMSQFATTIDNSIPYYIMTALMVLALIIGIVVVKTWKIANENPVISIKSE